MLNIEIHSNLLNIINKVSDIEYTMVDNSMSINTTIVKGEKGGLKVSGKGSKHYNSYIKGCIEEYNKQVIELENARNSIDILLTNIMIQNNKISFDKVQVYKEGDEIRCYMVIYHKENEYYIPRIASLEIYVNNFEVIKFRTSKDEELKVIADNFLTAYNKYITKENDVEIEENTIKTSLQALQDIYNIDTQLDALMDAYDTIQANRKSKGLSLAIYKCDDIEALQLIEIDKQIKALELKQDTLQEERKQLATKEYNIRVENWLQEYDNKKYKVVIDNITTFTNNFHELIDNSNSNNIKVFKLIYLKHERYKPYEINIYSKFINNDIGDLLEENRYYIDNDGYLLESKHYQNNSLTHKFIYRKNLTILGNEDISNAYAQLYKSNYNLEIFKRKNEFKYHSRRGSLLQNTICELTKEGQEVLDFIKNKYSKDKYFDIESLIA